jgi:hypothetical protein
MTSVCRQAGRVMAGAFLTTISNKFCTFVTCCGTNSTYPFNDDLHNRQFFHDKLFAFSIIFWSKNDLIPLAWFSKLYFLTILSNPALKIVSVLSASEFRTFAINCFILVKELQCVKIQTSEMARWVTKICQFGPKHSRSNLKEFQKTSTATS